MSSCYCSHDLIYFGPSIEIPTLSLLALSVHRGFAGGDRNISPELLPAVILDVGTTWAKVEFYCHLCSACII